VSESEKIYIPVVLGTVRKGRESEKVAVFVLEELAKSPSVETDLIDLRDLTIPLEDAGTAAAIPEFSEKMSRADGVVFVVPEYNHAYPGLFKHVIDTGRKEYIHKAVGITGVSAGPFGGSRVIESLLPVVRELGLVNIFWDLNFSNVQGAFDEDGNLLDEAYIKRASKFVGELVWMSRVLRHGRENVEYE